MNQQLDLARAINEWRVHSTQDRALQRSVELAREDDRASRRIARKHRRRA